MSMGSKKGDKVEKCLKKRTRNFKFDSVMLPFNKMHIASILAYMSIVRKKGFISMLCSSVSCVSFYILFPSIPLFWEGEKERALTFCGLPNIGFLKTSSFSSLEYITKVGNLLMSCPFK